jgi:SAM-dependent methyltransferase
MNPRAIHASPATTFPTAAPRGYDPAWFEILAAVEARHFWFRARNGIIATIVQQIIAERDPGVRLLEVGCGTGNVLRMLRDVCPNGEVVGLDLFEAGLEHARGRCDCKLVPGDILQAPFAPGSFDVIGMFDVLEHLPDDAAALRALHSLLAPGGSVVLTVPAGRALWSYFDEVAGHYRRYEPAGLIGKLAQNGFHITYLTHFMATIFPLVWAVRKWAGRAEHSRKETPDGFQRARTELKVRPVGNEILCGLLKWERWWIARRRSLPLGTSLLAVAQKRMEQR